MDNTVPNVDPILVLYVPMTKKVKEEGYEGAISVLENIQDLYLASDEGTKRALLELVNRLVFDGGAPFHKALIDAGILTLFANNSIDEIAKLIPVYFGDWKSVMNPEYGYILDDSVSLLENQQAGRFAGLTQKPRPGSVGQRILSIARGFSIFHMLSIHIARQALHLVVLLNDLAYAEDGLNSEQRRERIALEDELIDLEDAMKSWNSVSNMRDASSYDEYFSEIKEWYGRIFRLRFYFPFTRDPLHDEVFEKLLSCDKRTLSFREHCIRIQPVDIRAELEELGKDAIGIESALEKGKEPSVEVFETAKVSLTMAEIDLFRGEPTTLREYLENDMRLRIWNGPLSSMKRQYRQLTHDMRNTRVLLDQYFKSDFA
ncbi:hypothetical protein M408DRAFT_13002 [Serendipita vermifera MAFF 305830]|uniref:Uncharacterized protein n=1 Tax=Serendipita vermifera MAFF 305830 TaxID=933852 RepID=A0A0C2W1P6_SERVB|nr:hypothetical protein M408DRAFT_13002 [Serendipita vermifera MAFF 305830]